MQFVPPPRYRTTSGHVRDKGQGHPPPYLHFLIALFTSPTSLLSSSLLPPSPSSPSFLLIYIVFPFPLSPSPTLPFFLKFPPLPPSFPIHLFSCCPFSFTLHRLFSFSISCFHHASSAPSPVYLALPFSHSPSTALLLYPYIPFSLSLRLLLFFSFFLLSFLPYVPSSLSPSHFSFILVSFPFSSSPIVLSLLLFYPTLAFTLPSFPHSFSHSPLLYTRLIPSIFLPLTSPLHSSHPLLFSFPLVVSPLPSYPIPPLLFSSQRLTDKS